MIGVFHPRIFFGWVLLLLLCIFSGCKLKTWEEPLVEQEPMAPEIIKQTQNSAEPGGRINILMEESRGKIALLDFWATWSKPCRSEAAALQQLYHELKSSDFEMIGMNVNQGDPEIISTEMASWSIPYPVKLAGRDESMIADIRVVPTKLLLDRSGNVLKKYIGIVSKEEIKKDILALLAQSTP